VKEENQALTQVNLEKSVKMEVVVLEVVVE